MEENYCELQASASHSPDALSPEQLAQKLDGEMMSLNAHGLELNDQLNEARTLLTYYRTILAQGRTSESIEQEYKNLKQWITINTRILHEMWELHGEKMNLLLELRKRYPVSFLHTPVDRVMKVPINQSLG